MTRFYVNSTGPWVIFVLPAPGRTVTILFITEHLAGACLRRGLQNFSSHIVFLPCLLFI